MAQNYLATSQTPARYGNGHPNIVPYESFKTADGHIALAVGTDAQYRKLCQIIGRPDLWEDQRFQTNAGRVEHRHQLVPILQKVFCRDTTSEWMELLIGAKIPVGPINDIPTILNDPQIKARKMVREIEHTTAGTIQLLGPVAKLSRTPAKIRCAPPILGEHNEEILGRLGYTAEQVDGLREAGIL